MEDDVIIVDDESTTESQAQRSTEPTHVPTGTVQGNASERIRASSTRSRSSMEAHERATRSTTAKSKPQPKLKLKLSDKAAAQAPGMSFLGPYDRELDSDDEDLAFEEQFILRMPPGEDCDKLRKMVAAREVTNDVWIKFKDSRRAVFHIGNTTYSAKLVDLPCIAEAHKTLDNKQMFKVADICQMLVVENRLENDEPVSNQKNFNIEEFIWQHGITPPLHHVRHRRFRKRVNRRTIESVEQEVERLLEEDAAASRVQFEILENVNPDLSDSEFIERDDAMDAPTPGFLGSDAGDEPTPGAEPGDEEESEEEEEAEGDIDEELAAELDLALGDEQEEGDDEDDDDDDDDSEDEDEEEDDETVQARKLLNEEIRDLEAAVSKKNNEIASSANPLIRKRFEDALKKLTADLEMKLAQRDEMKEKQRLRKEGDDQEDGAANDDGDGEGDAEVDGEMFGSDGQEVPDTPMDMD